MVRTTSDETTDESLIEIAAKQYARNSGSDNFRHLVEALEDEYEDDGRDPEEDPVFTAVGQAVKIAADAMGYEVSGMIDFDGNDEVSVDYDSFGDDADTKTPHATPNDVARLVAFADENTLRDVWFEDGAGRARIYVEVKGRRENEDDE